MTDFSVRTCNQCFIVRRLFCKDMFVSCACKSKTFCCLGAYGVVLKCKHKVSCNNNKANFCYCFMYHYYVVFSCVCIPLFRC